MRQDGFYLKTLWEIRRGKEMVFRSNPYNQDQMVLVNWKKINWWKKICKFISYFILPYSLKTYA